MSSINFDNAYLLLIAIPIAVLLAVPFFLAVKKDNANAHNIASGVLHVLMGLCLAFALAGTTVETTVTETDVYVLADVSYSSEKNLDTIDNYIEELEANLPKNSKLGIVCFAKDQQLLVPLGKSVKSVKAADTDLLDTGETDIEGALDYASGLFKDGVIKRIVLMTDGKQTHVKDSNALKRAVDELRSENIFVDAVYIDNNISADAKEVQMMAVSATGNTYFGKSEEAIVTVRSSFETKATVSLYKGNLKIADKVLNLEKGNNTVSFDLATDVKGSFEYEVVVNAEGDENQFNNNATFSQTVSDSVNVLLISESEEDTYNLEERYSGKATVTAFAPTDDVPLTIEELCGYDEIVLSDVDLTKVSNYTLLLDNLNTVVSKFGKSLVTYGNVYTQDNEDLDALASMLPFRYGNTDKDSKLYTIVVDASLSMLDTSKFDIAKAVSKQLVSKLSVGDNLCIVSFNGDFRIVFSAKEISDEKKEGQQNSSRQEALNAIDNIGLEHGTVISMGLKEAYNRIVKMPQNEKQVMLISDGMTVENVGGDGTSEETKIIEILENMKKKRISTSVIDVGRGADTSQTALDAEALLKEIASKGEGKYTFVNTLAGLNDAVFGDGIIDDLTEVVINDNANVVVTRSTDSALTGVEFVSSDYVTGFIYNKAKSGTTTVLSLLYDNGNTETTLPLYGYWNYGSGRVASLATSLSNIKEWDNSRLREPFLENLLSTNIPAEKANYPFTLETVDEDGYINLVVTPSKVSSDASVRIKLTSPGETENAERVTVETDMTFVTSCYKYSFATYNLGKYEVVIDYVAPGRESYSANYTYYVSYLPEYDSFAVYDEAVLHKMIGSEGTVMNEDDLIKIENDESMISSYVVNLALVLLIIAVVLFVADVIVRKIKWEDIRSLFGKGRK